MMHKAWSRIEEVPYGFSRSYVKLQGHTAKKIVDFDPDWAFPGCNSSLNSPMATKWCTKLEVALKRCPIVFKVIHQMSRSHRMKNQQIWSNLSKFTRPVAAIKSLRFALFYFDFKDVINYIAMLSKFLHFLWKPFFPGQTPVPPRSGTWILDLSHDPIWAIWLAEVRKFHQHHDRITYIHSHIGELLLDSIIIQRCMNDI